MENTKKPLYQVSYTTSFDEYRKMARKVVHTKMMAVLVSEVILFVLLGFAYTSQAQFVIGVICFVVAVVCPLLVNWLYDKQLKKVYDQNIDSGNLNITYNFYPEHVELENEAGQHSSFEYADMHKRIETPTNIYLMVTKNQALTVIKDHCSPELIAFLEQLPISAKKK